MIKSSFRLLIVALCTIFTPWACKPMQELAIKPGSHDISISEAKSWLVRQRASSNGKQSGDSLNEYWSLAQKTKYTNGNDVIVLPVTHNYRNALGYWASKTDRSGPLDPESTSIQSKLLVFKDAAGNFQTEFIQIIPADEYRQKNKRVVAENFTGVVVRYDKEGGDPQSILAYKNGVFMGSSRPVITRNARVEICNCCVFVNTAAGRIRLEFSCPENFPPIPPNEGAWSGSNLDFGNSGGGGGGGGGGSQVPYTPAMLEESGNIVPNAIDNFFYVMENELIPAISFTEEEKSVIREFPQLIVLLTDYINRNGVKPDGSNAFKISAVDQQQYPRFTELVKGLLGFVEQHERVKNALINNTNLSWSKIKVFLTFGTGPSLFIYDLNKSNLYGRCINPGFPESRVEIQAKYVRGLESANLTGSKEATAFLLTMTLLHEMTHYGAVDGGRNETSVNEFGQDFEREVMGTVISKDNAGKLLIEFEKRN